MVECGHHKEKSPYLTCHRLVAEPAGPTEEAREQPGADGRHPHQRRDQSTHAAVPAVSLLQSHCYAHNKLMPTETFYASSSEELFLFVYCLAM